MGQGGGEQYVGIDLPALTIGTQGRAQGHPFELTDRAACIQPDEGFNIDGGQVFWWDQRVVIIE